MALLLLPGAVWLSGWKEKTISFENKAPARWPKFRPALLDSFPPQYEPWYNDHFPARNSLIFGYNYVYARYFHKSPKPSMVMIGKAGWLYMANNELNIYTGKFRFDASDLKKSLEELEYRRKACAAEGAEYRVVIIPSKFSVYPEYLPDYVKRYPGPNATDQLLAYVRQHSSVKIFDLRPAMLAAKQNGQLYVKGDNHWNGLGVFYAYQEIIRWLKNDYPIPAPLPLTDFSIRDTVQRGGNILEMIGMADLWKDVHTDLKPAVRLASSEKSGAQYPCPSGFPYCYEYHLVFQNKDSTLPGLLVMRESFTNILMRNLLSAHFGRTSFIWDKWEHRLNLDIVRKEKPKVVLCMVVESLVDCFENFQDEPKQKKE